MPPPMDFLPEHAESIGEGHWITRFSNSEGEWIGVVHWHSVEGGYCAGSVLFDCETTRRMYPPERHKWTVTSREPLTLHPSIQCKGGCRMHGYIIEGAWRTSP